MDWTSLSLLCSQNALFFTWHWQSLFVSSPDDPQTPWSLITVWRTYNISDLSIWPASHSVAQRWHINRDSSDDARARGHCLIIAYIMRYDIICCYCNAVTTRVFYSASYGYARFRRNIVKFIVILTTYNSSGQSQYITIEIRG